MINKYNTALNKKIYTLSRENVAQDFVRLARHFLPATFCLNDCEMFLLEALKTVKILSC